ncbi:MAG: zinc ribbon domain-containing protein [Candidatus Heimdallarchaeota archaeon]|nr:MAG: zinc ribbon domain-containing protein [Candidatus Heimdallarchaeota archaeon]
MNNPFDQISGQIIIKGRVYSAKEVIRGLLEQGIAITEGSEGLKIGFKLFPPESTSYQNTVEGNTDNSCPFIPYMSQITTQLEDLTARLNDQHKDSSFPPSNSSFPSSKPDNPVQPSFSPFNSSLFQSKDDEEEKDQFFSVSNSFYENRQKCPSCGATIPQNAFFCNKCGNHVRSG